jgi:hypothetical protein
MMTSDQFEPGVKFRYKKKDLMVLGYYFACAGHCMVVQAISANIDEGTRFLWVHDVSDAKFDECELIG